MRIMTAAVLLAAVSAARAQGGTEVSRQLSETIRAERTVLLRSEECLDVLRGRNGPYRGDWGVLSGGRLLDRGGRDLEGGRRAEALAALGYEIDNLLRPWVYGTSVWGGDGGLREYASIPEPCWHVASVSLRADVLRARAARALEGGF